MRQFVLLLTVVCAVYADQIVLKNGDIISGAIVKKEGGKLTLKSEFLGEVTVPWTAVKSIRSDQALTVQLPNGQHAAGKVSTEGEALEVATVGGPVSAPLAQVETVRNPAEEQTWERLQHPSLLQLWTGFFDTGLALARGNAETDTLTTTVSATRVTLHDKITATFNQIYGTARINNVTAATASAVRGDWEYSRNLTPRLFVSTLNSYDHDRFQDLDLRFVAGGGFGYNAFKTEKASLALNGGGDYEREAFMQGLVRNSGEANFGDDFVYRFSSVTNVTQALRFFPNLTDTGQYRIAFDLAAVTAIKKWLGWHVTASDRFMSNPVFGRQRNDLFLSTGLRVTFAH